MQAQAVSFGVDGQPAAFEDNGQICFRVEKYIYSHSIISFLQSTRDIDEREVLLQDVLIGDGKNYWEIAYEEPTSGMRLRRSTAICYGNAPAGFTTTDAAEPLAAGRYAVLMNATAGQDGLRFYDHFCLSEERHLIRCEEKEEPPRSLWERFLDWVF